MQTSSLSFVLFALMSSFTAHVLHAGLPRVRAGSFRFSTGLSNRAVSGAGTTGVDSARLSSFGVPKSVTSSRCNRVACFSISC